MIAYFWSHLHSLLTLCFKAKTRVKFESIWCICMINMDNFLVDTANGITPNMSLPEALKCEYWRMEHHWQSSCLTIHKHPYETAKQKVTDLVHETKKSYSTMVSSNAVCKELFYNMTILLGKTNPLFILFMIFNNFKASSVT